VPGGVLHTTASLAPKALPGLNGGRKPLICQVMDERPVPITMGSARFRTAFLENFHVTHAWFPPGAGLEWHYHERPTYAVMLEGSFDLSFPGRSYDCPPTTVFTEPPEERHGNLIGSAGARVLIVQPDATRTELLWPCRTILESVHYDQHAGIAALARRAVAELEAPDAVLPLALEALALEMLATSFRRSVAERTERRAPLWLERARELVHARYRENLQIAEIAEAVGVHPIRLARAFRAHYHLPLATYMRRLRLDWAAGQLLDSTDSLASIALQAGFSDQSHFTRAFKRHSGRTPRQFRITTN
jgi:AraC family transcriptional regulator